MTPKAERPPLWDDELEALCDRATAVLGDDAVSAAVERLFREMHTRRDAVSFADMKATLKDELRRLVRPH